MYEKLPAYQSAEGEPFDLPRIFKKAEPQKGDPHATPDKQQKEVSHGVVLSLEPGSAKSHEKS